MQGIQSINIPLHSKWVQTGQWQKSPETVVTASTDSDYPQFSEMLFYSDSKCVIASMVQDLSRNISKFWKVLRSDKAISRYDFPHFTIYIFVLISYIVKISFGSLHLVY
jgi:hypothetical protein